MPDKRVNRLSEVRWNVSAIQPKYLVRLKWRPSTPLGLPSLPEVKESVGALSGPTCVSGGEEAFVLTWANKSLPPTSPPDRTPLSPMRSEGTSAFSWSSPSIYLRTIGGQGSCLIRCPCNIDQCTGLSDLKIDLLSRWWVGWIEDTQCRRRSLAERRKD